MNTITTSTAALCSFILAAALPNSVGAEPSNNAVIFGVAALDEVTLIGLPKEDALKRLGQPEIVLGPEEGFQTYEYPARHQLSVVFRDGKLVQYVLGGDSKAKTAKGIQLGSYLSAVTAQYGDFSREEEVAEWFGGSTARVLFHHAEYNKFKLIYPDADVTFMFDAEKAVELIWVGFRHNEKD